MTAAVISLGTNTVRLLVVRLANGSAWQLEHRQMGTRLGEGLRDGGTLAPEGTRRTLEAVTEFARVVRSYAGVELVTIATSAMRRADDARAFAERMRETTGVTLDILDGATEAAASFRGATYGETRRAARIAVVDVGGGSTEVAAGRGGMLEHSHSIEIGSVRVTERFSALGGNAAGAAARAAAATARRWIADKVRPFAEMRPVEEVRCVAGTPATIAAIVRASHVDAVSGTRLSRHVIDETIDALLDMTLEARRSVPGMLAQRADILCGGGLVLSETLLALDADEARVESNDLLLGYLLIRYGVILRDGPRS